MTKEQEEIINRLSKITNRQILYGNKYGIVIEEFKKLQEDLETVLNMIKEKNAEIEKKDKIIDLMAEHICSSAIVDDTVCAIKCDCETDINEDCTYEKMLNCTKQYFERKATKLSQKGKMKND
jgi:hypothetical protein|nr:MAG TPA: hypothetical protein [Caudoviricetes sp.]